MPTSYITRVGNDSKNTLEFHNCKTNDVIESHVISWIYFSSLFFKHQGLGHVRFKPISLDDYGYDVIPSTMIVVNS